MTAHGDTNAAVDTMKSGLREHVLNPTDFSVAAARCENAWAQKALKVTVTQAMQARGF